MGKTKERCGCCGKFFSLSSWYMDYKRRKGQTSFYCSRRCSGKALSKKGYLQRSNRNRATGRSKRRKDRTKEDRKWAAAILKRDNYQCQHCGLKEKLQAHHIIPYAKAPDKRLKLSNGITLCATCHSKQHPELPPHLFFKNYQHATKRKKSKTKSKKRVVKRKTRDVWLNPPRS